MLGVRVDLGAQLDIGLVPVERLLHAQAGARVAELPVPLGAVRRVFSGTSDGAEQRQRMQQLGELDGGR